MRRLLCMAALALALPVRADVLVDDFSTGAFSGVFAAAPGGSSAGGEQAGSMAAGHRQWQLSLFGASGLGGLVDISPAGFEFRSNLGVGHRFDWFYGDTYVGHDHRLDLDFSHEQSLRFAFAEVQRGLNFNVLLYYDGQIDNYSQVGINIAPTSTPVNIDFSFAAIAAAIAVPSRPADLSHVSGIYIVTQSGGAVAGGGESFRMTSISTVSAVPESPSAALAAAGLIALWGLRRSRGRRQD